MLLFLTEKKKKSNNCDKLLNFLSAGQGVARQGKLTRISIFVCL